VLAAAAAVGLAGRDQRIGADTATAVAVSGMLGAGGLVAFLPDVPPRLGELLFGDPLSARPLDLIAAAALLVAGGLALAALHRPLTVAAFDPQAARSLGLSPGRALVALLALVGLAVGVAAQGLGNLLVLAVLVAPAVAVRGHATSPLRAMLGGAGVATSAGVVGIYVSFGLELAAGASVALALCLAAATGNALAARRKRA
jgi:ABC-type Mn2+/Zn2+ transport system permease subunit